MPELLKLGAAIEVLGPEERRTAVVRTLRAMNHTDGV
nr:WYL domain-containing protein [Amycolatopsis sp. CA-126428]